MLTVSGRWSGAGFVASCRGAVQTCLSALVLTSLAVGASADVTTFQIELAATPTRTVDVQVSYPSETCAPCQLVVFSHGAFSAPERYERLLRSWGAGGYVIAAPLHVDSELNPSRDQYDGNATMLARLEDYALLTDSEELRSALAERGVALHAGVIAAGHSYGALIAQAAAGARLQRLDPPPAQLLAARARIVGVVALSPPGTMDGYVEAQDYALVEKPMLVVTGTTDILPGFVDDWRGHLASYEAASVAPAYALIFTEQDHYFNGAFGRPKDDLAPSTVEALASLNTLTLRFMRALTELELPASDAWMSLSGPGVEARAAVQ